jgi:hypothetical protein
MIEAGGAGCSPWPPDYEKDVLPRIFISIRQTIDGKRNSQWPSSVSNRNKGLALIGYSK